MTITPTQLATLGHHATHLPALDAALEALHEIISAQYREDCHAAADNAAKACYQLADQATLLEGSRA